MKNIDMFGAAVLSFMLSTWGAQASQVATFENLPDGEIATTQFPGVVFTGGSVLTTDLSLNPQFPPNSGTKLLYNYADGAISLDFTMLGVTSVGAFVTGNGAVTESIFSGTTLLGMISTGGSNYIGSGTGLNPNIFLNLAGTNITSAVFANGTGSSNTFTIDDVTIGGSKVLGTVPLPASAPMFGAALLVLSAVGYGMRRNKAAAAGLTLAS